MTYDNTNRGALFRNERREADTDADYKGTVNIEGTEYWIKAATHHATARLCLSFSSDEQNKCLARSNKSRTGAYATKKRNLAFRKYGPLQ